MCYDYNNKTDDNIITSYVSNISINVCDTTLCCKCD